MLSALWPMCDGRNFCLRPCGPASRFLSWRGKFCEIPAADFCLLVSKERALTVRKPTLSLSGWQSQQSLESVEGGVGGEL